MEKDEINYQVILFSINILEVFWFQINKCRIKKKKKLKLFLFSFLLTTIGDGLDRLFV